MITELWYTTIFYVYDDDATIATILTGRWEEFEVSPTLPEQELRRTKQSK